METPCRILVVDDEIGIVSAVRRELTAPVGLSGTRYQVETFTDPRQALARAREQIFDAVLADYRMPEMDGLAFLEALSALQPDCARMVLSGQTDLDALIRMINETHIYRFLQKPWQSEVLRSALAQALALRHSVVENRRLAGILRRHGVEMPLGPVQAPDHVLVLERQAPMAERVVRELEARSRFDAVFRAMRLDSGVRGTVLHPEKLNVVTAATPEEALRMAEDISLSCLVADFDTQREWPGFLAHFARHQTDCAVVLLAADIGMSDVVELLAHAHLQALLGKPVNGDELRAAVGEALARRHLLRDNAVLADLCRERALA